MIGHQDTGMEAAVVCTAGLVQQLQVKPVVVISMEANLAVVAALGDVLGDIRQVKSGWARHGDDSM